MKDVLMIIAFAMAVVGSAVQADNTPSKAQVSASLHGDWAVKSEPSYNPQIRSPESFIRFNATNYVYRIKSSPDVMGGCDQDTGEDMPLIQDPDGSKYLEMAHWSAHVCTNTLPWQIDLWTETKDGKKIEKKGLCEVKGDILKICLSHVAGVRPSSFEGGMEAARMQVTTVGNKQGGLILTTAIGGPTLMENPKCVYSAVDQFYENGSVKKWVGEKPSSITSSFVLKIYEGINPRMVSVELSDLQAFAMDYDKKSFKMLLKKRDGSELEITSSEWTLFGGGPPLISQTELKKDGRFDWRKTTLREKTKFGVTRNVSIRSFYFTSGSICALVDGEKENIALYLDGFQDDLATGRKDIQKLIPFQSVKSIRRLEEGELPPEQRERMMAEQKKIEDKKAREEAIIQMRKTAVRIGTKGCWDKKGVYQPYP